MSEAQIIESIVGRGAKDGARLFREWFQTLTEAPERGEKAAYVFVMGSLAEVLRVFDFHTVFPEINSLQTAVDRKSTRLNSSHGMSSRMPSSA